MSKRVVITGVGAVTPLGNDVKTFWDGISKGKNGIGRITRFDPSEQKATLYDLAGMIRLLYYSK